MNKSGLNADFMAVVSREVCTLLHGIVGLTDRLEQEMVRREKGRDYLAILRASTGALTSLINDILDYACLFSFQLTFDKATPEACDTQTQPHLPRQGASILVVEDNRVNQMLARKQLSQLGHTASVAENGQEALDILSTQRFDLVLMDIHMPVMDGIEATRQLRARGETLPILAMTASVIAKDADACLASGMQAVITKPVSLSRLGEVLDHYLAAPGS